MILFTYPDYRLMEKMGEGTFSEVLKCQSMLDGKLYACKKMKQKYRRWLHKHTTTNTYIHTCTCIYYIVSKCEDHVIILIILFISYPV